MTKPTATTKKATAKDVAAFEALFNKDKKAMDSAAKLVGATDTKKSPSLQKRREAKVKADYEAKRDPGKMLSDMIMGVTTPEKPATKKQEALDLVEQTLARVKAGTAQVEPKEAVFPFPPTKAAPSPVGKPAPTGSGGTGKKPAPPAKPKGERRTYDTAAKAAEMAADNSAIFERPDGKFTVGSKRALSKMAGFKFLGRAKGLRAKK